MEQGDQSQAPESREASSASTQPAGNDNQFSPALSPERKRSWYRFTVALLVIFIVTMAGISLFERYVVKNPQESPGADQLTIERVKELETALRNDTYGGRTPEETLKMFVAALKNNDMDLASKYFAVNTNEQSPYYLTQQEWNDALRQKQTQGEIANVISIIEKMVPSRRNTGSEYSKDYVLLNNTGVAEYSMSFKFNKYSNVWKIESL